MKTADETLQSSAKPTLTYFGRVQELAKVVNSFFLPRTEQPRKEPACTVYIRADDPVIWCEYCFGVQQQ